jgi:hypothetical protein
MFTMKQCIVLENGTGKQVNCCNATSLFLNLNIINIVADVK